MLRIWAVAIQPVCSRSGTDDLVHQRRSPSGPLGGGEDDDDVLRTGVRVADRVGQLLPGPALGRGAPAR